MKKILIAAGGTGGHIYPAIGTADKLIDLDPTICIRFAAAGLENNPFFNQKKFAWESISSATPNLNRSIFKNCGLIAKGIWQSCKLLSSYQPDLVVGFGSYHSFPILAASTLLRYPIALHEQNSKPGKVNRLFSKYAKLTGVFFPSASQYLKNETIVLPMPLREGLSCLNLSQDEALKYYELESGNLTLLVFGGSQGAHFINKNIPPLLKEIAESAIQVLHFTGNEHEAEKTKQIYSKASIKAVVKVKEDRMDFAWKAADLAIVRAGAVTIAEQIEFEVPAVFIPFPHAADGHQESNADFVVNTVQGGWKWKEEGWNMAEIKSLIKNLIKNKSLLMEKKQNLAAYKQDVSQQDFANRLLDLMKY